MGINKQCLILLHYHAEGWIKIKQCPCNVWKGPINMVNKLTQSWCYTLKNIWAYYHFFTNSRKVTITLQSLPPLFCTYFESPPTFKLLRVAAAFFHFLSVMHKYHLPSSLLPAEWLRAIVFIYVHLHFFYSYLIIHLVARQAHTLWRRIVWAAWAHMSKHLTE